VLSLPRQVEVRAFRKEQKKDGIVNNPKQGASKMLKVAESVSPLPWRKRWCSGLH